MRALIFVTGASLFLAACKDQGGAENAANANADLAAAAIFANDTTAIDAATGDAANMAADVDYTVSNGGGDVRADGSVDRRTVARRQATDQEAAANDGDSAAPMETGVETNDL